MFVLPKVNKKGSSRHQISIKGIDRDVLILPNDEYRMVLETSSINFYLMSDEEQDAVVDLYKAFLNSLSFPIQILQKVRSLDLDEYLRPFEQKILSPNEKAGEHEAIYSKQIQSYIEYVRSLVETKKILARQFFIVIPYHASKKETIDVVRDQLAQRVIIVEKGLNNVGVRCDLLNSLELLDLFYASYNASDAKQQPLTQQTMELLRKNYF